MIIQMQCNYFLVSRWSKTKCIPTHIKMFKFIKYFVHFYVMNNIGNKLF